VYRADPSVLRVAFSAAMNAYFALTGTPSRRRA